MIGTGALNRTYYNDGEQVFPCRCGQMHKGDFSTDDYLHPNCYHNVFWLNEREGDTPQVECANCGKVAELGGVLTLLPNQ